MKNIFFIYLFLAQLLFGSITVEAQALKNNEALKTRIDSYLNASVVNGFSGSVLVAIKGEIILSKGYGWSDRKNKIPNTSSTVFNIGSITKQFTASAILKLVEKGKIETSNKIGQFFIQAPVDKKDITIHQLLTHTSGISSSTGGFRYDEATKDQFLTDFFESELQSIPGTKHQYANANYIMLSVILEVVSKQSYGAFLNENLWYPSQMNSTGYKSITFNSERLAHGYYYHFTDEEWRDWGTTQEHLPYSDNHWYSIGKGDIHSTVEDLYKWHLALQDKKVLSANSIETQNTPHVSENENKTSYYGYGWAILTGERDTKIITHNGSNGVYFADFIRYIDEDIVIIYFTNAFLGYESENVAWEISKMTFNLDYNAVPLSRNVYELINDFIKVNNPENAETIPSYLEKELGKRLNDPAVLNRLGYSKLKKEEKSGWALELFRLNVQLFPDDGNLWDSLGEAYLKYDQREEAIKCYQKAVKLGNESSSKQLRKLLN